MNLPSPILRGRSAGEARTALYQLCFANLPNHRKVVPTRKAEEFHVLDIKKISTEIGISEQKVSKWMQDGLLPGQRVPAMVNLQGSNLTYEMLGPYINTR
jgi:ribosomal protein S16